MRLAHVPLLAITTPLLAQAAPAVTMTDIDIGTPVVGENPFHATLASHADTAVLVVLDLRATPGMWLLRNRQAQFPFHLEPRETRRIEAAYVFDRMSPEARLRVRLGPGQLMPAGYYRQDTVTFERWYPVGAHNSAALDLARFFVRRRVGRFEVYAWKGSLAAGRIDQIVKRRNAAVDAVRGILNVEPPRRIRLVFYPDSATKARQTGHIGVGLTLDSTIVEIYNADTQLDPYHELAHVLTSRIGDVPALFNEGFAVYVSERLGAHALEFLGRGDLTVDQAACRDLRDGTAFPLAALAALPNIGPTESRPQVSYPQAASIVRYLIETYGVARFRALYRGLAQARGSEAERTTTVLQQVVGVSIDALERAWRSRIEAGCR